MTDTPWNRAGRRSGLELAEGMLAEMELLIDPLTLPEAAAYIAGKYDLPPRHAANLTDMYLDRTVDRLTASV